MEEIENDAGYKRMIAVLYTTGFILNVWFLYELLKETPKGSEVLDKIKKPFKGLVNRKNSVFGGQHVVAEAEEILRGANNG